MKEPEVINAVIGPRVDNVFDKEYIIAAANHYSNGDDKRLPFHSCYGIKEGFVLAGNSGIRWSFRQRRLGKRKDINASKKVL